jgi:microcystin-dependent protein
MSYTIINIGVEANDGTGSPLRTAFDTVNDNFQIVNDGLYAGTRQTIISALSVQSDTFVSNSYILANTYVSADSLIGNTLTSNGNLYVSQGGAYIFGNVNIIGNLSVTGSQAASQSQQSGSPILALHYSASPLVINDGKDIGTEWQYYDGAAEKKAFLGWQNSSRSLVYLDDITDTANVITAGYFGNMQVGSLTISNTTSSTSNVTGALQVFGGTGIQGNLYVASNVFVGKNANIGNITVRGYHVGHLNFAGSDTIYINGSPVQTAAQAFNGGTVGLATVFADTTASTGLGTGAVRVAGGFSANGNVFVSNLHTVTGGNIRSNIIGNVITSHQPFITSLGSLTGLIVNGQSTQANIVPTVDNQHWLGTPGSRWVQGHFFNLTASQINGATSFNAVTNFGSNVLATSGTDSTDKTTGAVVITGFGGLGVGGTVHVGGNVYIDNINDTAGLIASTSTAYVFNETATTIEIGRSGQTIFGNALPAISTISGAVRVTNGGMSITQGNLYIGGSAGNAVVATGNISATGNLVTLSNIFASGNIVGGFEASRGFLGNLFGSPITGNTHVGSHLLPTANVRYSVGSHLRRYETIWANVTNSLFVESANVTTANIVSESGAFTGVVTALTAPNQTANTMIATTEFVVNNGTPSGALMMWATGTAPTGWLLCNGAEVSRTTYATLFSVIGTTFGLGNGSSTFNLPNYTNRMPVGAGGLYAVAGTGGSKDAIVVAHSHTLTDPGHLHAMNADGRDVAKRLGSDGSIDATSEFANANDANYSGSQNTGTQTTGITMSSTGTSGTDANMPPFMGIQFIIKT